VSRGDALKLSQDERAFYDAPDISLDHNPLDLVEQPPPVCRFRVVLRGNAGAIRVGSSEKIKQYIRSGLDS
jgi:hypothetical protein